LDKITKFEERRIVESFYKGDSRKQIGAEVHHSSATGQRVIKEHEQKVKENGLISELSDEGLREHGFLPNFGLIGLFAQAMLY